ncbi:copper-binding protein [Balneolaceae bacterium ANBcel3]|nr:copper-binding protein [Balneolaceae bacterium ANBcel3]
MQTLKTITTLTIVLLFAVSCTEDAAPEAVDSHLVNGRFLSVDEDNKTVSIVHETVPEVMNAMRMNFRIDNLSDVDGIESGDVVQFEMELTEQGWYARNLTVLPSDTSLDLPENLQHMGMDHHH